MKAIILLGFHDVGKDTLANKLIEDFPGEYEVAKFSQFAKNMLAYFLDVTTDKFEDKYWRSYFQVYGSVTPLDLLNALFYAKDKVSALGTGGIDFTLNNIDSSKTTLFTDIRGEVEYTAVLEHFGEDNVKVFYLYRKGVRSEVGDDYISDLLEVCGNKAQYLDLDCTIYYEKFTSSLDFTDLEQCLKDYVRELYLLNADYLADFSIKRFNCLCWGFPEEVYEFLSAKYRDSLVKEAGDVVAYVVLILLYNNFSEDCVVDLLSTKIKEPGSTITITEAILAFISHMKRVNRDEYFVVRVDENFVLNLFVTVFNRFELCITNFSLQEILDVNIYKLKGRKLNGTLYQGSGDNR